MNGFWNALRVTTRTLGKAPGFTGAVIATLAVGIALETTILSTINAYLLRSLPYPAADRLYQVAYAPRGADFLRQILHARIPSHLAPAQCEKLLRRDAVARQIGMHLLRRPASRRARIAEQDAPSCPA